MSTVLALLNQQEGRILLFVQNHMRFDVLNPVMRGLCTIGAFGIVFFIISILLLFSKKTRRAGVLSIIAMVISMCICMFVLKQMGARVSPYETVTGLLPLMSSGSQYCFPSEQVAAAIACATVVGRSTKKATGPLVTLLAFLVAWSRLYVGVNYLTDLLAGAIVGLIVGIILFWIFGDRASKRRQRRKNKRKKKRH